MTTHATEIDWEKLTRDTVVQMLVTDDRSITLKYDRATMKLVGNDHADRSERAREQIAQWREDAVLDAIPVVVFDATGTPVCELLVLAADGELYPDDEAPREYSAAMQSAFDVWLSAEKKSKRPTARHETQRSVEDIERTFARTWVNEDAPTTGDEGEPVPDLPTPIGPDGAPHEGAEIGPEPQIEGEPVGPETEQQPLTVDPGERITIEPQPLPGADCADAFYCATPGPASGGPTEVIETDDPFAVLDKKSDEGKHQTHATYGLRGTANMLLGLSIEPDDVEKKHRADLLDIRAPWNGCKVVSVVNRKGGAGKTPYALGLGATFGRRSKRQVAVFDNNESAGNSIDRVEVAAPHYATAKDFASFAAGGRMPERSEINDYVHAHDEDRYDLLASHEPTLHMPAMTAGEVADVYRMLGRFYELIVTDSGNTTTADNWREMLRHTDQLVVPVITERDRFDAARGTLKTIRSLGGRYAVLADNPVIAVSAWRPGREHKRRARDYGAEWADVVGDDNVVTFPYDEQLSSHNLRFDRMRFDTQLRFDSLGAATARGLRATVA